MASSYRNQQNERYPAVKDKNGNILRNQSAINSRWTKCFNDLLNICYEEERALHTQEPQEIRNLPV